ncbi:hypothetical protein, partial [Bartonella sp. CL2QHWL]|uniref:hypothetical protein n=1 Tax=Bartonella sp. CL2QHWL TaxID=3243523 RepID=UPI0035CE953B
IPRRDTLPLNPRDSARLINKNRNQQISNTKEEFQEQRRPTEVTTTTTTIGKGSSQAHRKAILTMMAKADIPKFKSCLNTTPCNRVFNILVDLRLK